MLEFFISFIFFICGVLQIILVSIVNRENNIFCQKIDLMKANITKENLGAFVLRKDFKPKHSYIGLDCTYYDEFYMGNYFYKKTIFRS